MPKYPHAISSKLPKVGTTIFTIMSKMATDYGAINLSQGFPDFPLDAQLIELVNKYMRLGYNQYPPMAGIMSLRETLAQKMLDSYGTNFSAESEITITSGATQGVFTAINALINEGDEVIIFTPAYDCYAPAVELVGGKPVYVQLKPNNFRIDWDQVKKVVTRRTKLILINSPHNPTGATISNDDVQELIGITRGNDIIILSDEVYEHIVFDDAKHLSLAKYPELAERTLLVYSFGKTFHVTGWKMGYVIGPENLMVEFRKVHQFNVFTANAPIQYALNEYMQTTQSYLKVSEEYQKRRNIFIDAVKNSRFTLSPASGTYFQLLNYSQISEEPDEEFAIRLTKEFKVASIPVSVFYHNPVQNKVLRFCFAKEEETLLRAGDILSRI
jgi:methionine aminotransferase